MSSAASCRRQPAATTRMRSGRKACEGVRPIESDTIVIAGVGATVSDPEGLTPLCESEAQIAQLLDRCDDLVARLQPDLLLATGDDALRRAGEDDIAGPQRHVLRDVADQLLAVEHHVVGV